ncbi:dihydrodipicolinate synthase family protein [Yoonia sp.]|uniref:dihydrodipicolinate synthase family protein n=1 Tax=Yoonia sp. TaxID=2212373 RepID=UPI0025E203E6|nr:dihydrodipicolinate synthase family protein [Yoonia sp.]
MTVFHGLSAFPITPTDPQGRVATDELGLLLERLAAARVDSVGLLGSTGGYAYLTRAERQRAITVARAVLGGQVPVIIGISALRTDDAQTLARDAQIAGADGLLLAPMSYTPLTQEEVFQHYVAVARATDLPLCIYNNPGTTHFTFDQTLLERLGQVENVAAVKMPLPQAAAFKAELAQLRAALPDGFAIGYSGDWGCAAGLLAGADAWYSVIGGLFPAQTMQLARAAQAGNAAQTEHIESFFQPLWTLFKALGSLRVVYAAAAQLSLTQAVPPRPILPLDPADRQRVAAAIETLGQLDTTAN